MDVKTVTGIQAPIQSRQIDDQAKRAAGAGSFSAMAGQAPDGAAGMMQSIASALASFQPAPGTSTEVRLADVMARLKETVGDGDTDRVVREQESKRKNMQENQAKLEESQKKLEESEAKSKSGNIFNRIAQAFQALAAVIMIAIGTIGLLAGGSGAALIVAGAAMAAALIDSLVAEQNDGKGMFASAVDGMMKSATGEGLSEKAISALNYTSMAIGLVVSIVAGAGGPGALMNAIKSIPDKVAAVANAIKSIPEKVATAANMIKDAAAKTMQEGLKAGIEVAKTAAKTAASVADEGAQAAGKAASVADDGAQAAGKAANAAGDAGEAAATNAKAAANAKTLDQFAKGTGAVTGVGGAVADVGSKSYGYAAAKSSAEAAELRAQSEEIQALMAELDDLIDQALTALMASSDRFNAMLDGAISMLRDTGDVMSSQQLTA
ncbi:MAG: hypothetical protein ACU0BF_00805 [Paracoccaceae bacterium]